MHPPKMTTRSDRSDRASFYRRLLTGDLVLRAGEIVARAPGCVAADHDVDRARLRERDRAALARAVEVGPAVERRRGRRLADADVEIGVAGAGHVELVGAGCHDG